MLRAHAGLGIHHNGIHSGLETKALDGAKLRIQGALYQSLVDLALTAQELVNDGGDLTGTGNRINDELGTGDYIASGKHAGDRGLIAGLAGLGVNGVAKAVELQTKGIGEAGDLTAINLWEKNLAFNLGGHTNHSIFWTNMTGEGASRPEGELGAAIDEFFGSFESFQAQFAAAALGLQGSGWAVLAWDTVGKRLVTYQMTDQQGNIPVATVPLLMIDMWEHAFYLDYLNVKADYVKAWWNLVNWENVASRFQAARLSSGLVNAHSALSDLGAHAVDTVKGWWKN